MTPVLYILMRNDLASLNPGKAMAQASHASNAFVRKFHEYMQRLNATADQKAVDLNTAFYEWENSTVQGFGTVLVLEGNMNDIDSTVYMFQKLGYVADLIHDPTYPIVDGSVVHYIPINTCAYVFVQNKEDDDIARILLQKFPLHK
jgi:peptidyl-tRNA hydrolase